jgi:CRP-like cAMP-binding protein
MSLAAKQNRVIASVPDDEFRRLDRELSAVKLLTGQLLHRAGERPTHVYFPTTAVVSLVFAAPGAPEAELATVGSEGIVGFALSADRASVGSAVVQTPGFAFRLATGDWQRLLERPPVLRALLLHSQALLEEMAQTTACLRNHSVLQQICRWLLLCLDRTQGDSVSATQASIASRLGVRRGSVSECAGRLQADGLLCYTRGRITVLDRQGLEARACGCYEVLSARWKANEPKETVEDLGRRSPENPDTISGAATVPGPALPSARLRAARG